MSELACLLVDGPDADADVLERMHAILRSGRCPVLITLRRPVELWKRDLEAAGLDPGRAFFIDATPRELEGRRFLGNVLYVGSPVHLEAIAMRARMACRRDRAHLVLDSIDQVADVMGDDLAQVFSHALANTLRHDHVPGTFVVGRHRARLVDAVQGVCDAV